MDWIPSLFRRRKLYSELSEEIRLHIEERAEQLMADGISPEQAQREACRAFGNRTLFEERSREVWQWSTLESIWDDVRFALRQLRRSPGFTFAAIATLALAIGANAVVFSVMNAFILRPLNVPEPESLYALQRGDAATGYISYPNYLDLRDRNRSFAGLVAYNALMVGIDTGDKPSIEWGEDTSGNYLDALGIQPYLGRFFHASDEHGPNSAPYIVLSYSFWNTHFQDDRGVVGRVVRLNGNPFTVIGVGPPQFHGTLLFFNPAFFVPMVERPLLAGRT
jgi:macrolide transport system ATP-binding/permease protein